MAPSRVSRPVGDKSAQAAGGDENVNNFREGVEQVRDMGWTPEESERHRITIENIFKKVRENELARELEYKQEQMDREKRNREYAQQQGWLKADAPLSATNPSAVPRTYPSRPKESEDDLSTVYAQYGLYEYHAMFLAAWNDRSPESVYMQRIAEAQRAKQIANGTYLTFKKRNTRPRTFGEQLWNEKTGRYERVVRPGREADERDAELSFTEGRKREELGYRFRGDVEARGRMPTLAQQSPAQHAATAANAAVNALADGINNLAIQPHGVQPAVGASNIPSTNTYVGDIAYSIRNRPTRTITIPTPPESPVMRAHPGGNGHVHGGVYSFTCPAAFLGYDDQVFHGDEEDRDGDDEMGDDEMGDDY